LKSFEEKWGQGNGIDYFAPSLADDQELRRFYGRLERSSASPGAAQTLARMDYGTDVRHVLPTIIVPTLVQHRTGELAVNVEHARYMARHIRGAKYVEFPGPLF
jgi:pimeloyl-ACP methyl ester carboxylesterase